MIGYRWYDARNLAPLFAFGHGLSYTTFEYSDLAVAANGSDLDVSFTLRNSGQRAGAEVAQIYLEQTNTGGIATEVRKLAAFGKFTLAPGSSRRVTLTVPARSFDYWNTETHSWTRLPGNTTLHVGSSSRDLRLRSELQATPPSTR